MSWTEKQNTLETINTYLKVILKIIAFNIVLFVVLDGFYDGSIFLSVSEVHAVTAFVICLATAIAALGQLYHGERRIPFVEPDAFLMFFVILGGLFLIYSLG